MFVISRILDLSACLLEALTLEQLVDGRAFTRGSLHRSILFNLGPEHQGVLFTHLKALCASIEAKEATESLKDSPVESRRRSERTCRVARPARIHLAQVSSPAGELHV